MNNGSPAHIIAVGNSIRGVLCTAIRRELLWEAQVALYIGWRWFWPPSRARILRDAEALRRIVPDAVQIEVVLRW